MSGLPTRKNAGLTCLLLCVVAACGPRLDDAKVAGAEHCASIESVRRHGGEVLAREAVFIGSIDRSGAGTLFDVQCGYRLFGIAYSNEGVRRELLRSLSEGRLPSEPLSKFYLFGTGRVSVQGAGDERVVYVHGGSYTFRLDTIVSVAPISRSDSINVIVALKRMKRLRPDRTDF